MYKKQTGRIRALLTAAAITATALIGSIGSVSADTWPYTDHSKAGRNQPLMLGHRAYEIETWSPETDPYADLMRAEVPLQKRISAFQPTQANPSLNPEVQTLYMAGDYGNSFNQGTPYNNQFSENMFQHWQYVDQYYSWHGAAVEGTPPNIWTGVNEQDDPTGNGWATQRNFEFGSVNMPNPGYTNAAHKNGVLSMGCVYFDPNNRPGQPVELMLKKGPDGRYILADKLVEFAKWYGFDGYFFNFEEDMDAKYVPLLKALMKQTREAGMYAQMYDSLKNDGNINAWKSTLDADAYSFLEDPAQGKILDSVFISYDWSAKNKLGDTMKTMQEKKMSQSDAYQRVFFGVEANQGKMSSDGHNSTYNFPILYQSGENDLCGSIALFTPDAFIHDNIEDAIENGKENNREKDEYQWMVAERERMYFAGAYSDPTDTGVKPGASRADLGLADVGGWVGVADFMSERSVVGGNVFATSFNTGHGLEYRMEGRTVSSEEWGNMNLQDLLPTWQWWIDGSKLNADFDYGTKENKYSVNGNAMTIPYQRLGAYEGGSSLAIYGKMDADSEMHLYKTNLAVQAGTTLSLTYNKPTYNPATMSVGLIFKDAPNAVQYLPLPDSDKATGGWKTADLPIGAYAGRNIAAVTLKFSFTGTPIEKYQVNLGQLVISDSQNYTPAAPRNVTVENAFNTKEMVVSWDLEEYSSVKQYHVYANYANGSREFLGGIYGGKYYVKSVGSGLTGIEVRAVGADGSESAPAKAAYSYDSAVSELTVQEAETSTGFFSQSAEAGAVQASWKAPRSGIPDSYGLELTLNNSAEKKVYSASATGNALSAKISVPINEGEEYTLKVTPVKNGVKGTPVCYTGYLKDTYCAPFDSEVEINGTTLLIHPPKATDWWKMQLTWNGKALDIPNKYPNNNTASDGIRGVARLNDVTVPTSGGTLGITLVDYSGNTSKTVSMQVGK